MVLASIVAGIVSLPFVIALIVDPITRRSRHPVPHPSAHRGDRSSSSARCSARRSSPVPSSSATRSTVRSGRAPTTSSARSTRSPSCQASTPVPRSSPFMGTLDGPEECRRPPRRCPADHRHPGLRRGRSHPAPCPAPGSRLRRSRVFGGDVDTDPASSGRRRRRPGEAVDHHGHRANTDTQSATRSPCTSTACRSTRRRPGPRTRGASPASGHRQSPAVVQRVRHSRLARGRTVGVTSRPRRPPRPRPRVLQRRRRRGRRALTDEAVAVIGEAVGGDRSVQSVKRDVSSRRRTSPNNSPSSTSRWACSPWPPASCCSSTSS